MLLGFRTRDQRLRSGETLARPLLLRSATLGCAPISHGRRWMLFPSTSVSPVLNKKPHARNRAAWAIASECNMMLRMEALVHSIKSGESAKRPAGGEFPAGTVYNVERQRPLRGLKVGLDAGIPEVQINLFCAFGLDAGDTAEVQMMSGQHEHRGPRTRQLFARLCRYLCRGAPASSQASNRARFNLRRERPRHRRMQKNAGRPARSCDARAHEPQLCARIEKGRGRDNKLLFEQSRRFSLSLRHKPRENLGPWPSTAGSMYTKGDRASTSTAAL